MRTPLSLCVLIAVFAAGCGEDEPRAGASPGSTATATRLSGEWGIITEASDKRDMS